MKIVTIILFLVSNLILGQSKLDSLPKSDTIWIKPGVGIDNIKFGETTDAEIKNYRNWNFEIDNGEGYACGDDDSCRNLTTDYQCKVENVRFLFSTPCISENGNDKPENHPKKLTAIYLKQTENACLENGICIGETTYEGILEIMDKPRGCRNKNFLAFYDKGISFHFDNERKIYSVKVYTPR